MRKLLLLIAGVALTASCGRQVGSSTTPTAAALPAAARIVKLDSRFDKIVPRDAVLEKVADGFAWAEGPVWNRAGGFLLSSDVPNNLIIKWKAGEGAIPAPSRLPGESRAQTA